MAAKSPQSQEMKTCKAQISHQPSTLNANLSNGRHPSLVLFLGACVDGEPKIIISEYLSGGSLEDVYNAKHKERGGKSWRPPTQTIHMWALELARALNFLHKCIPTILHRDLKPGNLLLTQEGHLKVSDFGLSKIIDKTTSGAYQMTGVTGTLRYMAPEVMRSESYNEKVRGKTQAPGPPIDAR